MKTVKANINEHVKRAREFIKSRFNVILAGLSMTTAIVLTLFIFDPSTRELEKALLLTTAFGFFALTVFFWLKQLKIDAEIDNVIEIEWLDFPAPPSREEPERPIPEPKELKVQTKTWCRHCGSTHVLTQKNRIYCIDCGLISRVRQ